MPWTPHAQRIREFMRHAQQELPPRPCIPDEPTRLLRAKLIFEEALETIHALGVTVRNSEFVVSPECLKFSATHAPNLIEIVDGCCDVSVVTIGTLIACGVQDQPVLEAVDKNNLDKFGPGGYRSDGTDGNPVGKWIKPPWHRPPDIAAIIADQEEVHE
jgi:predicted HAD superfamily Cof-like phosphohydrolase